MLAAIIANLQNVPQPVKLPVVKIDRGGGGQSWPSYEIVDIIAAISAFPEISGEHPVARGVRRHRWIGEALPFVKEAREKREAVVFLAGAQLGDAAAKEGFAEERKAAEERHAVEMKLMAALKIDQLIEIVDSVRWEAPPAPVIMRGDRDRDGVGIGLLVGALGGLLVGIALTNKRRTLSRTRSKWI